MFTRCDVREDSYRFVRRHRFRGVCGVIPRSRKRLSRDDNNKAERSCDAMLQFLANSKMLQSGNPIISGIFHRIRWTLSFIAAKLDLLIVY